ncbi:hypothetical protein HID58_048021, partial [Brassica napus]
DCTFNIMGKPPTPSNVETGETSSGITHKRKRGRPPGSRTKSRVLAINEPPTFKPKYYDCKFVAVISVTLMVQNITPTSIFYIQKNARNMRKAILLSKRTSTTSQDAPTQPYGVRHIRNKKK